jgi:hypothetical protein
MAVAFDAGSNSGAVTSTTDPSWTHTPVGTPAGVVVFVNQANATNVTIDGVTYGGSALSLVAGSRATDTTGEPGYVEAWFLGSSVPTGAQTVTVSTTNAGIKTCTAVTVTASGDTEVTGVATEENDQVLTEENVDDGSPGTNSLRLAAAYTGLPDIPSAGANSTSTSGHDHGARAFGVVYETTAGQGSRPVGFSASSDDVAAVYLAIREPAAAASGGMQLVGGAGLVGSNG